MKEVSKEILSEMFEKRKGRINMIYGQLGSGKTTHAVRCMFDDLKNGVPVYSNINLDLSSVDFNDFDNKWFVLRSLLPRKDLFFIFDKKNFHFFNSIDGTCDGVRVFDPAKKEEEVKWLNSLMDCNIYYDEGYWLLDSGEHPSPISLLKMRFIYESRQTGRTFFVISQRSTNINRNCRSQVEVYYRCQSRQFLFWEWLYVQEFQEMSSANENVLEENPSNTVRYFDNHKYWKLFNTNYLRNGRARSQEVYFQAFSLSYWERVRLLFGFMPDRLMAVGQDETESAGSRAEILHLKVYLGARDESKPYEAVGGVIGRLGLKEKYNQVTMT